MSIGNSLNNFGQVTTAASTFMGIVCIVCLMMALAMTAYGKSTSTYKKVRALVTNPSCTDRDELVCTKTGESSNCRNVKKYNCQYDVTYNVKGQPFTASMQSSGNKLISDGERKLIEYDTKNPFRVRTPFPFEIIMGVLGCMCVVVSVGTVTNMMFSKSRTYRQLHAGATGLSMVKNVFN